MIIVVGEVNMKYYEKNGKVIARSYPTKRGIVFEKGCMFSDTKSSCVMNNFFATSHVVLLNDAQLRRSESTLGLVTIREL